MVELPPHPYVPGVTARHPENWFDDIKASLQGTIAVQDLDQTQAFQTGLAYLRAGYFWECHELLEPVWMRCPKGSPEREMTQALIQLANARLKQVMGKPRAVLRLCERVEAHLAQCPEGQQVLSLSRKQVSGWVAALRAEIGA